MHRMTLQNEAVVFTPKGVWILPMLSDGFWFGGSPEELIRIMVTHTELDIDRPLFRVREREQTGFYISPSTEGY